MNCKEKKGKIANYGKYEVKENIKK